MNRQMTPQDFFNRLLISAIASWAAGFLVFVAWIVVTGGK